MFFEHKLHVTNIYMFTFYVIYTTLESRITVLQTGQWSWIRTWHVEHIEICKHGDTIILLSFCKHTLHNRFSLRFSKVCMMTSCALIASSFVLTKSACAHTPASQTEMQRILCLMSESSSLIVGLMESFWKLLSISS